MKPPALSRWLKSQVEEAAKVYRRRLRASLIPGTYTIIKLSGVETIVSNEDAHLATDTQWSCLTSSRHSNTYVMSKQLGLLHRVVVGLDPDSNLVADHINGDGLDNRRENLRVASRKENVLNTAWADSIRAELHILGFNPTNFKRADRGRLWHYTPDGPIVGPRPS